MRAPRTRTAFTWEQLSALERTFQHHQYLGPLERRKLAQEVRLPEAQVRQGQGGGQGRACPHPALSLFLLQIKTWFQNRRMKHKRQTQDAQLNVPLSGPPHKALGWALWLQYSQTPQPEPQTLVLPPGCFWGPCPVEQAPLTAPRAACGGWPLTYLQTLGATYTPRPALSAALATGWSPGMPSEAARGSRSVCRALLRPLEAARHSGPNP